MRKFKVVLIALIIFIGIQFFRPERNQSSTGHFPEDIATVYTVPPNVKSILKITCYDCHSNNTSYPWYMNIQPVGWFMARHIRDGKEELNFNEYATYSEKRRRNKLKRMKEQVISGKMPLPSYTMLHADARLTANQRELVLKWIDGTLIKMER
ncbi:heme-binding domain-containing protein [Chitinophaga cymbidii]|uniref:Heme-binding protein n=1 Tax=Chitinophaga cymbidii TaxID=1096750 RepID=A0A512RPU5_9BACT|nr:heme-binding domain-containing protein [Chitinophaga cymbidii]GEP97718.1 heme-binding protein [Chitinophaga cymbidii]